MVVGVAHDARMSIIPEFFVAPDDPSASPVLPPGVRRRPLPRRAPRYGGSGNAYAESAAVLSTRLLGRRSVQFRST